MVVGGRPKRMLFVEQQWILPLSTSTRTKWDWKVLEGLLDYFLAH